MDADTELTTWTALLDPETGGSLEMPGDPSPAWKDIVACLAAEAVG